MVSWGSATETELLTNAKELFPSAEGSAPSGARKGFVVITAVPEPAGADPYGDQMGGRRYRRLTPSLIAVPPVRATRKEIPTTIKFPTNLTSRSAAERRCDWDRDHEEIERLVALPVEVESRLDFFVWRVVCCTVLRSHQSGESQ
jgi:hypothetical protein